MSDCSELPLNEKDASKWLLKGNTILDFVGGGGLGDGFEGIWSEFDEWLFSNWDWAADFFALKIDLVKEEELIITSQGKELFHVGGLDENLHRYKKMVEDHGKD